jgi:hypothetical protein
MRTLSRYERVIVTLHQEKVSEPFVYGILLSYSLLFNYTFYGMSRVAQSV